MLQKQRWVFTQAELDNGSKFALEDEFDTGPLPTLSGDGDRTELGVIVQRNGGAINKWSDGTTGVPDGYLDLACDTESLYSIEGDCCADQWRDVICTPSGDFVCFATSKGILAALFAVWESGKRGSEITGEGLHGWLSDNGYLDMIEDLIGFASPWDIPAYHEMPTILKIHKSAAERRGDPRLNVLLVVHDDEDDGTS